MNVDLGGEAARVLVEKSASAIDQVFGPAARQLGAGWGKRVELWQLEQAAKVHERLMELRRQHPTAPKFQRVLSDGEGFRALEAVASEDDADVREQWARLLRNATDTSTGTTVEKTFVELLKQMTGPQAVFLHAIAKSESLTEGFEASKKEIMKPFYEELSLRRKSGNMDSSNLPNYEVDLSRLQHDYVKNLELIFCARWRTFNQRIRWDALVDLMRHGLIYAREIGHNQTYRRRGVRLDGMITTRGAREVPELASLERLEEAERISRSNLQIVAGVMRPEVDEPIPVPDGQMSASVERYIPELKFRPAPIGWRLLEACRTPDEEWLIID